LTPELERFAADAVTFEQAITAQSWTLTAYVKLGLVNSPHLNPGVGYGRAFDIYNFDHKRGVAYTDHHLGRFLDLLRMRHLYNDALIVVTAIARLPRGAELASSESDREGLRALGYLP
jgi:hypothetical protein